MSKKQIDELKKQVGFMEEQLGKTIGAMSVALKDLATMQRELMATKRGADTVKTAVNKLTTDESELVGLQRLVQQKEKELASEKEMARIQSGLAHQIRVIYARTLYYAATSWLNQLELWHSIVVPRREGMQKADTHPKVLEHEINVAVASYTAWKKALEKIKSFTDKVRLDPKPETLRVQGVLNRIHQHYENKKRSNTQAFAIECEKNYTIVGIEAVLECILKELLENALLHHDSVRKVKLIIKPLQENVDLIRIAIWQDTVFQWKMTPENLGYEIGREINDKKNTHVPVGLGLSYLLSGWIDPKCLQHYTTAVGTSFALVVPRG